MKPIIRLFLSALSGSVAFALEPGMGILLTENGQLSAAATVPIPVVAPVLGDGVMLVAREATKEQPVAVDAGDAVVSAESARVIEPLVIPPAPKVVSEAFVVPSAKAIPDRPNLSPAPAARKSAMRPDANGLVVLVRNTSSSAVDEARQTRNPWGVRVAARDSMVEYKLALDGLVSGPSGGTALINGVPVRIGERLIGPFVLAEINTRRGEATMEYDGSFFVLTEGRNVEVRIPKF